MTKPSLNHGSNHAVRKALREITSVWGFEETITALMDLHEEQTEAFADDEDADGVEEMQRAVAALNAVRRVYDAPR